MNRRRPLRSAALGILAALAAALTARAAGDLLRRGAPAVPPAAAGAGAASEPAAAAQMRANASDSLARTTQAMQAVQAMQAAARALAAAGPNHLGTDPNHPGQTLPDVPDGLAAGGLAVAPGGIWTGAGLPAQSVADGKTTVAITQTSAQAILNWQTLNVGKNTTLAFDQSAGGADVGQWVAFNRISDPSGVPSQILGSITAQGQVYVINRNGIIFGGSSQVNAHALVASSLPINDNLVTRGLLNNPDQQFLFSALPIAAGASTPAFTPLAGPTGDVTVQSGARLSAPTTAEHVGGRVVLLGRNVTNAGTVSTPDGQTIFAAGLQVGMAAHDTSDPSLRGLDVFVGAVADSALPGQPAGGTVVNSGLLAAPRASVVLAGKDVSQLGVVDASTSVAFNGRVDLLADYYAVSSGGVSGLAAFFPKGSGTVTLGPGSVTRVLPELDSAERVVGTRLALPSQLNLRGLAVHLAGDAAVLAPGATVTVDAGNWSLTGSGVSAASQFVRTGGQIYLDAGALIDVSGSFDVFASVAENIVEAQLRGAELANSPLQRDGPLRGLTVKVDARQSGTYNGSAWVGTPLADVSGYVALIQRSVGELTVDGGAVTLRAGESVVLQPGSAVNVSGGWISYHGANVATTKLLADGRVIDIAQATPDRVYTGVAPAAAVSTDLKWGVTLTSSRPLLGGGAGAVSDYEAGYLQGGNGGRLAITAPAMALDGALLGQTVAGPRQRASAPGLAALSLVFQGQYQAAAATFPAFSPTPPLVTFQASAGQPPAAAFALDGAGVPLSLRAQRKAALALAPELFGPAAFGALTVVNSDGDIALPAGTALTGATGGALTLVAANLDLAGSVTVPGGKLDFTAYDFSPFSPLRLSTSFSTPPPDFSRGRLTLAAGAVLSVAGLVVDDRPSSPTADTLPLVTAGGSIALRAHTATLAAGSVLDVSGGVAVGATGKFAHGAGGSLSVAAGQDPDIASILGGALALGAELRGYSGGKGGALTVLAPLVRVGATADAGVPAGTLLLTPDFFSSGGFNSFTIKGLGAATATPDQFLPAVVIAPGTVLAPVAMNRLAMTVGDDVTLTPTMQPAGVRLPVSLVFNAVGVRDPFNSAALPARGDLVLGAGAAITTDPKGSITLAGDTVTVLGSVSSPGGAITVSGGKDSTTLFLGNQSQALPTVVLGPGARLSVAGTTLLTPDARGFRAGTVLAGGKIGVTGNLVAAAGALLDVSGAADTLDLLPAFGGARDAGALLAVPVPTRVESDGGAITLTGGQELFSDATLRGLAGGSSAQGGSLVVSSGKFFLPGTASAQTPLDVTLVVTQSGPALPAGTAAVGVAVAGEALGHFAADSFAASGLDSLTLKGTVQFSGPVALAARRSLAIADGGVILADAAVALDAPYVALGAVVQAPVAAAQLASPFNVQGQPFNLAPTNGPGSLTVTARSLIDLGSLALRGIGRASLATAGDIRGDGTFDIAGDITLLAGQIFPPTETIFTIAAYDHPEGGATIAGSITIAGAGVRQTPLSAGGTLNLYATTITQGGVLRAPVGAINLGWDGNGTAPVDLITGQAVAASRQVTLAAGSVTSVAAIDPETGRVLTLPYGLNLNGTAWIDPSGTDITAGGLPAKSVNITAKNVSLEAGALVDVRGGGDLYAYRFVSGTGGKTDILASTASFAILPGYLAVYAPFSPYNPSPLTDNFGGDKGYANGALTVGDRVHLTAGGGLAEGDYTLLPARYALLPGAFLVTPQGGTPGNTATVRPDGAALVPGWRFNALNAERTGAPLFASFEVASAVVVRARAEYADSLANTFLASGATRLPADSGQLVLAAAQTMAVRGAVMAQSLAGGRGGLVDISSPADILIAAPGAAGPAGALVLDAAELSAFGAESLLVGGVRTAGAGGVSVAVRTGNLTVDNRGAPLTGSDLILVANQTLALAAGAGLGQSAALPGAADTLLLGSAAAAGSGNGVLVRVSGNVSAPVVRSGVTAATGPGLTVGAGVRLAGAALTLDSTGATALDPTATLNGSAVALDSGRISLALTSPGVLQPNAGLVLSGGALENLQASARALSLLSYSSIDIYGGGQVGAPAVASLALHAAELRGFNPGGGTVTFAAQAITLDNSAGGSAPGAVAAADGTLVFDGEKILLGANQLRADQYAGVILNATGGVLAQSTGGLAAQGALTISAPLVTGATAASATFSAGGALTLAARGADAVATVTPGLGASLTFGGASVAADTSLAAPGGALTLRATAGDVAVGAAARLDARGVARSFFDVTEFTDSGQVSLVSDTGNVSVAAGGVVTVAAQPGGGNAGGVTVVAAAGAFTLSGALLGTGGAGGTFALDAGALSALGGLNAALDAGGFEQSRSFRARGGDVTVDGTATAKKFSLAADNGSITVSGTVDASGATGGAINLAAQGGVTLLDGARLTVAAQDFNSAGKGGAVSLEAGAARNGVTTTTAFVDVRVGSVIDLSVAANSTASAALGRLTGTLHLRAPQNATGNDLQVLPVNGTILGASSIVAEGYRLFDLTAATATITGTVQTSVRNNGTTFGNATATISARLLAGNAALTPVLHVRPGAEINNRTGNLVLATTWDLSAFRSGPASEPGVLTLRASGNLSFLFKASLSDGFNGATFASPLLAVGAPSWSYRLVAGADFTAADFRAVRPLASLATGTGSVLFGTNATALPTTTNNSRSSIIPNFFQVIRTGTGDIDLAAGRDVQLLNPLAAIYTAGAQAAALANFDLPNLAYQGNSALGTAQTPNYAAQFSLGGGDITVSAGNDITHLVLKSGSLVADSTRELPNNWLYRRGYVNPATGLFDKSNSAGEIQSTAWWVDFSNFFEGVGALGGGNVKLVAGRDVSNVDAAAPTNARMPKGAPSAAALVELGGGDVTVRAGRDIDGGVYYVERGAGTLAAGRAIRTNATRAALTQTDLNALGATVPDPVTWLPTTLFAGKARFAVTARNDLLLGPVANPFLLPQGINNSFYEKSYFSTYSPDAAVTVASLVGAVTLRDNPVGGAGSLLAWFQNVLFFTTGNTNAVSRAQPWLRLAEQRVSPFATVAALMPPTLHATAFSGDFNLVGGFTLAPSAIGDLTLAAAGAVNGLQPNSLPNPGAVASLANAYQWATATLNLSDADPARVPSVATPLSLASPSTGNSSSGGTAGSWNFTPVGVLDSVDRLFAESGSTEGTRAVIQTKQALHAAGLLHAADTEPIRLLAGQGDISGLTLYAGKPARVAAGRDLTDLALYVQNNQADDLTVVTAGRDLVAYAPNTPLRLAAQAAGNALLATGATGPAPGGGNPTAGDIQVGGPGALEILAGRNLDLGVGPNAADGTAVGVATIGNARNPALPFDGASVVAVAGLGGASGPDIAGFAAQFLDPATGGEASARYLPVLAAAFGLAGADNAQTWAAFNALPVEQRGAPALEVFYRVLRDAGRGHNDPDSAAFQFRSGFAAVAALFPGGAWRGDISLTSREIKTASGGDISLLAPGGQLAVGFDISGSQAADQGILTEHGGDISIFTHGSVNVGTSRIFTLRGGDEVIWSSAGNIAAGAASKTVQSAPPTRVLIDPQSGDVKTDLAGLATGGGIGVLATVAGVAPGDVDLIAPSGTIDAGDAGIRSSGRLNVAAVQVLNASNIAAGGGSAGVPAPAAAPSLGGVAVAAAGNAAAASSAAGNATREQGGAPARVENLPSIITVEVLGYGGGEGDSPDKKDDPAS